MAQADPGGIAGAGVTVLAQADPGPLPESIIAYYKKGEESSGIIQEGALADLETGLGQQNSDKAQAEKHLGASKKYIHSLHLELRLVDQVLRHAQGSSHERDP